MGGFIDKITLNTLIAVGYYLLFMAAFGSIPLACALAFVCSALTHKLLCGLKCRIQGGRRMQRKALRRRIDALIDEWTLSEPPHGQIAETVKKLYPECAEDDTAVCILPRPAACPPLEGGTCFDLWQAHRREDRLLIVCTGRVSPTAFTLAQALSAPRVRILDRSLLAAALEKRPDLVPETQPKSAPLRRKRIRFSVDRKHAPRSLLSGTMLLAMHFLLGNFLYLLIGLALITAALLAFRRARIPEKLF